MNHQTGLGTGVLRCGATRKNIEIIRADQYIEYMASFDLTRAQAILRLESIYSPLIEFLRQHGLLADPGYRVPDWSQFVLMSSALTEEGLKLYAACEQRWLNSISRGKKNRADMRMWERELQKLRGPTH